MSIAAVLAGARRWHVEQGDALAVLRALPDGCVQTCVTSPPYWGLRDYGVAGQLGLEPTPAEYVSKMVEVFREVRRVLRDDGTLWLNIGDTYIGGGNGGGGAFAKDGIHAMPFGTDKNKRPEWKKAMRAVDGLKPKDLALIPFRLAIALQADGWYVRMDIVWHKPNAMPESVDDRPTRAHEYVFLLSKSVDYFYDADAIKEKASGTAHARGGGVHPKSAAPSSGIKANESFSAAVRGLVADRNKRSVWTILTRPVEDAHFATFPPEIVEPCILAGSSERGACESCGAPWTRVLGDAVPADGIAAGNKQRQLHDGTNTKLDTHLGSGIPWQPTTRPTIDWQPSCDCDAPTRPCLVLDPFSGSGTTGMVALRHSRRYLGIELNHEYVEMSRRRIDGDAPLFNRESA